MITRTVDYNWGKSLLEKPGVKEQLLDTGLWGLKTGCSLNLILEAAFLRGTQLAAKELLGEEAVK